MKYTIVIWRKYLGNNDHGASIYAKDLEDFHLVFVDRSWEETMAFFSKHFGKPLIVFNTIQNFEEQMEAFIKNTMQSGDELVEIHCGNLL